MHIRIVQGDITDLDVGAVVNAANSRLAVGAGVDGAIHRVAGPQLNEALQKKKAEAYSDGLPVGEAFALPGYDLPAEYVIFTVGPRYGIDQPEADLLTNCFRNSLAVAEELGIDSVAFPAISCGIYDYPHEEAAVIARNTIRGHGADNVVEVTMCLYEDDIFQTFDRVFSEGN